MFELSICCPEKAASASLTVEAAGFDVWRDNDGIPCAYAYSRGDKDWIHLPGLAQFSFDLVTSTITAFAPSSTSREAVIDAYYRTVLPMALQASGHEVLHASGVRIDGHAVALTAVSGTGKSTFAHALSRRGAPMWADDAFVLSLDGEGRGVFTQPLPFRVRLRASAIEYFGPAGVKQSWSTGKMTENQRQLPVSAVFVLDRDPSASIKVTRLTGMAAFQALLTNSYCYSLRAIARKRRMIENYLSIATQVPVFQLRFKADWDSMPTITDTILDTVDRMKGTR
jgi:hypothetical protein